MTYIHVEEGRTAVNEERVRVRLIEGFGPQLTVVFMD